MLSLFSEMSLSVIFSPPMKRKIFSFPSAGSLVEDFIVASITKLIEVKTITKTHMMVSTNSSEKPEVIKSDLKSNDYFLPPAIIS